MSQTITQGRLRIDANFKRFVDEEVLPGVELDAAAFWHNVDEIVHDLAPENRQLLAERDRIQAVLDEWHRSNPGPVKDKAAYKSFLRELGYLVPQPERVTVETTGIDSEITSQAGPQLVVPAMNARYALNAANARWGSLYDALYGSDIIPHLVEKLNKKPEINGILVQLPLPKHLDEKAVIEAISPEKDVDAFHASNVGKIMIGDYKFLPCTPAGVMELIHSENIEISGKNCVVIGRSNIVGKPMAMLLLHENGTVTITHSRTKNLAEITRDADILIAAVGKPKFVTGDMVKEGAVVIDVGMDRDENGKLCGDVDFDSVEPKASYITPVPGGVGPMTIAMLMKNTLMAAKIHAGIE